MKTLTLHCPCGQSKTFDGLDANAVIKAIDRSKWEDRLYEDNAGPLNQGHGTGCCPKCLKEESDDD